MEKAKERFLKNLYERQECGKTEVYHVVADCAEGGDIDVIKELDKEGYIQLDKTVSECAPQKYKLTEIHVLTDKGFKYLSDNNLI